MRLMIIIVGLFAVLVAGAGCTGKQEINAVLRDLDKANERLNNLNRRVDLLQTDNQMLTHKIEEQRRAMEELQGEVDRLQTLASRPVVAAPTQASETETVETGPVQDVRAHDGQQQAVSDFLSKMKAPKE